MKQHFELRHLYYFQAVAEELNFRRAAEKLFVSQPGLSRQIKQLEQILGVQLLERDKKHVALTAAGSYLKDEIDFVANHLGFVRQQLGQLAAGLAGEIRIGFVGTAAHHIIPDLFVKLDRQYPGIQATLEEMSNMAQVEKIVNDSLDLGFVRLGSVPEGLSMQAVQRDGFVMVVPESHAITHDNFTSMGQFKDEPFILFSSGYSSYYYDTVMGICKANGFQPKIRHKSVNALTIFKLVECGVGVSIVPASLSEGYRLKVRFLPLAGMAPSTDLSVVWKPKNRNPALRHVMGLLGAAGL